MARAHGSAQRAARAASRVPRSRQVANAEGVGTDPDVLSLAVISVPYPPSLPLPGAVARRARGMQKHAGMCKNATALFLYDNRINRITNLERCTRLTHVCLQHNNIRRLEGLHTLYNLKKLRLGHNAITVVEGLHNCYELEELHIEDQKLPPGETLVFDPRSLRGKHAVCRVSCVVRVPRRQRDLPRHRSSLGGGRRAAGGRRCARRRVVCVAPDDAVARACTEAWQFILCFLAFGGASGLACRALVPPPSRTQHSTVSWRSF